MNRQKSLDGYRGICAFFVVLDHCMSAFYPNIVYGTWKGERAAAFFHFIERTSLAILYHGHSAVSAFFVLSGYVLSQSYFRKRDAEIITSGAFRRYFRLALPVFVSSLIAYYFMQKNFYCNQQAAVLSGSKMWLDNFYKFKWSPGDVFSFSFFNVFFAYREDMSFNAVLWTMQYEMIGSLIVFCFLGIFGNFRRRYLIYLPLCWFFLRSFYFPFILGIMLSDIEAINFRHPLALFEKPFVRFINRIFLFLLFALSLLLLPYPYPMPYVKNFLMDLGKMISLKGYDEHFFTAVGALLMIYVILHSRILNGFFSSRPIFWLGKVSFPLYLIHLILICSISSRAYIWMNKVGMPPFANFLLSTGFTVVLSLVAAYVLYFVTEIPSVAIPRVLYQRLALARPLWLLRAQTRESVPVTEAPVAEPPKAEAPVEQKAAEELIATE